MYLEKYPYNINIKTDKYPSVIPAFIEVSEKSRMKYEWDHSRNSLVLDRVLQIYHYHQHQLKQILLSRITHMIWTNIHHTIIITLIQ